MGDSGGQEYASKDRARDDTHVVHKKEEGGSELIREAERHKLRRRERETVRRLRERGSEVGFDITVLPNDIWAVNHQRLGLQVKNCRGRGRDRESPEEQNSRRKLWCVSACMSPICACVLLAYLYV